MSMPQPSYRGTTPPRTVEARNRADAAAVLLEHGLDRAYITELLDSAELHGDAQSAWVRVCVDGETWLVDLVPADPGGGVNGMPSEVHAEDAATETGG